MKKKEFVNVFGLNVYNQELDYIKQKDRLVVINTISPNSYGISVKDGEFKNSLKESDYLVLDGVYFALASILKRGKAIKKNQGPDVFYHFMDRMKKEKGKVFFLGSSEETLCKIKKKNEDKYREIEFDYYSPPYKDKFTEHENNEMLSAVNKFKPDILFVGMTCPKQEKWVYENRERLNAKYAISIGGVFDWYAGNEKEIAPIWWKLNLAWLIRTINRPEILKRYPNIGIFFWHLLLSFIKINKY